MEAAGAMTTPSRSDIRLSAVDVPKASDVLAGELRERILNGELAEGAPLPARARAGQTNANEPSNSARSAANPRGAKPRSGQSGACRRRIRSEAHHQVDGQLRDHAHPR